ncbi:hypothetical protein Tco_0211257 [Tanacetum coccineum]
MSTLVNTSSTEISVEISAVKQKHDELLKKSLLNRSQFEGQLKEKSKVISDLKVKEGKDIDTMIEMEKQIKFLNEILYKRNQSIQTIHMLAPKCATYNGRSTFANPKYLKKAQSDKPRLYEIPYDTSDPANRFCPDGEETVTLEKESRSKLDKDTVKPYNYTYQNSLYETFKPPSKAYLDQLERAKEVRKTMWRKTFVRTKPNIAKNEWKWWIAKRCPSGYTWTQKPLRTKKIWMPKVRKDDESTSISPTIDIVSRITNILKISNSLGSNLSSVPSSSNSLADCTTHPIHYQASVFMAMMSIHISSGLVLLSMTSIITFRTLKSLPHNEPSKSSKLVPKVVPLAVKTATSRQELELLFHHHIAMLRTTGTIPFQTLVEHHQVHKLLSRVLRNIIVIFARTFRVILFSIHNDEWKSFQCHHQTALRSNGAFKIMQKYEHVGQRHKIAKMVKTIKTMNKGSEVKIAKHEGTPTTNNDPDALYGTNIQIFKKRLKTSQHEKRAQNKKSVKRSQIILVPTGSTQFLLVVRFSLPGLLECPGLMEKLKAHKLLFKDVVGQLVKKVKALELKLRTRSRKVVMSESDKEEEEEHADLERQRAEMQRKRQQDVLDSAKYYTDAD